VRLGLILAIIAITAGCALPFPAKREELFKSAQKLEKDKNHIDAFSYYEEYLRRYPEAKESDTALGRMFEIALKNWEIFWGKEKLIKLAEKYPAAPLAGEAIFKAGEYLYRNTYYDEATLVFETLIKSYPENERVEAALFMWGESELKQYEGEDYESMPLDNAKTQYERLLKHYPESAFTEKAKKRLRQITKEFARREFKTAMYYRKHGKPKSMKAYLESIIKNYPESDYAQQAEKMLSEIPDSGD